MTHQLASAAVGASAHGHGRHIPLVILGVLVIIIGAACYYAWHHRK
jgi:hypothetical protein